MTVVEFTVHCQTSLPSKVKGKNDSCLFLTVIRDATLYSFISKCSGDIIILYAIFCTIMDFTNMFVMSLDFSDVKNNKNMSKGMTYRTN